MKISHERNDTMTTRTLPRTGEKRTSKLKYQILTGLMAAMITLMTAYLCHIPTGINGGYIHLGDAVIYLAQTSKRKRKIFLFLLQPPLLLLFSFSAVVSW